MGGRVSISQGKRVGAAPHSPGIVPFVELYLRVQSVQLRRRHVSGQSLHR